MASQWAKIGGQFQRVTLNDYELENLLTRLLKSNKKEFMRCLETSRGLFSEDKEVLEVAKALFDKQATASYTAIKEALEKKIDKMKRGEYTEPIETTDIKPKPMETKEGTTTEQLNTIKEQIEPKKIPEAPKPPEENASSTKTSTIVSSAATLERTPDNPEFREKAWDPDKGGYSEDKKEGDKQ